MRPFLLGTMAAAALAVIPADAHHSFAAYYFEEQTISIEGEVVEFEYRNPHAWVHVMGKDADGRLQRFSAEWAGLSRLQSRGVVKDTLKPGDHVIISGSPGRNPWENRLHLKSITRRADGWTWGGGRR